MVNEAAKVVENKTMVDMDPSEKYKRKRRDKTTKNKTMVDMGASEKDKEFWTEKVLRAFGGHLRSLF